MIEEAIKNIINYGKLAGQKDLTSGISGNISVRCGDNIVITASGSANGYLNENDFAILDLSGNQISKGNKASSEKLLHLEFYRKRKDVNAVYHLHSPYLTTFAMCAKELDEKILPEIVYYFDKIPLAEYGLPGSEELACNTSLYFDNYDVVLMKNHGVVVGGTDLKDAFLKLELCETYAKTLLFSKLLGGANILSEEQVKQIYSLKH